MKLERDVLVSSNFLKPNALKARLEINSGTHQICNQKGYCNDSFHPNLDWQLISTNIFNSISSENSSLLQTDNRKKAKKENIKAINYSKHIQLIKVPANKLKLINKKKPFYSESYENYFSFLCSSDYSEHIYPLAKWANQISTDFEKLTINPMGCNQGNKNTVTRTRENNILGLHLDRWDGVKQVDDLSTASNRICINVGIQPRYLIFANLSIKKLLNKISKNKKKNFYPFVMKFFNKYPDYPLFRLKILPGEAYIAPTENMIHDGSTLGQEFLDFHLTMRGVFIID